MRLPWPRARLQDCSNGWRMAWMELRSASVEQWPGDGREEVSVFVGVDVGDVDAGERSF